MAGTRLSDAELNQLTGVSTPEEMTPGKALLSAMRDTIGYSSGLVLNAFKPEIVGKSGKYKRAMQDVDNPPYWQRPFNEWPKYHQDLYHAEEARVLDKLFHKELPGKVVPIAKPGPTAAQDAELRAAGWVPEREIKGERFRGQGGFPKEFKDWRDYHWDAMDSYYNE